ncbi:hypothetical protein [Bradyrhizobium vignae]|uniref:Uncharacterized protein n=1 Tax=Bradyrhizobium vignae TaxID=1549949 RepID=A0A2U3PVD9_9BRAD|nr:hypothetical protein [Bradyrhizobium vignae]SPP93089.1 exported protein of unknown function [Bradyrhizobium vignae]
MRFLVSVLFVATSLGPALAGDLGFAFDNFEQQFKKSQDLVKIDLGLEKEKCQGDGKSRACTYKSKAGTTVIIGTKGSQVEDIVAIFEKPGAKAGYEFLTVSAWAIAFGSGVSDPNDFGAQYKAATDSYVKQANSGAPRIEVTAGNYKWTMFRVGPKKDEMFVKALN